MAAVALDTTVNGTVARVLKLLMSLLDVLRSSAIMGRRRSERKRKSGIQSSTASSLVDAAAADESSAAG